MFGKHLPISHRAIHLLADRVGIVLKIIELGQIGVENEGRGEYIATKITTLSNCVDRIISIELRMADKRCMRSY